MNNREIILCALLDCELDDLKVFDKIEEYDLHSITRECVTSYNPFSFKDIIDMVIYQAVNDLIEKFNEQYWDIREKIIKDIKNETNQNKLYNILVVELKALDNFYKPDAMLCFKLYYHDSQKFYVYLKNYNLLKKWMLDDVSIMEMALGLTFKDMNEMEV